MIIELKKIFLDEKETFRADTEIDFSDLEIHGTKPFDAPIHTSVFIHNKAGIVILEISVKFEYRFSCDRCTAASKQSFEKEYQHILVLSLSPESGDDYIEAPEYRIELDDIVRDDIVLDLPSKLLCREDCKGLCSVCGKNLNEGACGCSKHEDDPRLAVLRQLLSD